MKKIVALMLIYTASCSILAMDESNDLHDKLNNLTREEKKTILERKKQVLAIERNPSYYYGSSTTPEEAIAAQFGYITQILDQYHIPYPENIPQPRKYYYDRKPSADKLTPARIWLEDFSKEVEQNLQNADFKTFKETGSCIGCNFANMDLRADIASLNARGLPINLTKTNLQSTNISECNLSNADLSETDLRSANLRHAQLRNTNLKHADTLGTELSDAVFDFESYSNRYAYYMRNGINYHILDATVYPEDKHIKQFSETGQCEGCALADTDLRDIIKSLNERGLSINLKGANLDRSNAAGTDLSHADLSQTHCKQTNFSNTNLTRARLSNSFCKEANFTRTILRNAIIDYANMRKADLSYADLKNTNLDTVDLEGANTNNISGTFFNRIKKLFNKNPILDQQILPGVVDISGMDKAKLLATLYNWAGTAWDGSLSEDEAKEILQKRCDKKRCGDIDYIGNVALKVNLCGDTMDVRLYNRNHGDGEAQRAIEYLKRREKEKNE